MTGLHAIKTSLILSQDLIGDLIFPLKVYGKDDEPLIVGNICCQPFKQAGDSV